MHIPLSDMSPDIIMMHLAKASEHLTEASNYAPVADVQYYTEVSEVSQLAFLLTLASKQFAQGNQSQAQDTLRSVHGGLSRMINNDS